MPDPYRLAGELCPILEKQQYGSLLRRANTTAKHFSEEAAWALFKKNAFIGEVTVVELKGPAELYRAYDGISHHTGLTLGSFWCDRPLMESMWAATSRLNKDVRRKAFFDFFRSATFVHPQWNLMTDIACLYLPAGNTMPVFRGRGDWRALRGTLKPTIQTHEDVSAVLKWMPIPGPHQYMVPYCGDGGARVWAFNDMWIRKIPQLHSSWPLA